MFLVFFLKVLKVPGRDFALSDESSVVLFFMIRNFSSLKRFLFSYKGSGSDFVLSDKSSEYFINSSVRRNFSFQRFQTNKP